MLVATSLATANGFAPKHAHAIINSGHNAAGEHSHEGHDHHHLAPHSHDNAQEGMSSDEAAVLNDRSGLLIVNCCVASCSATVMKIEKAK